MDEPPPYNHLQHGEVGLSMPPLDPNFPYFPQNDDVFTTTSIDGDFPVDVDFDFTFDDLSFADNLLLEQPDPNSDPELVVLSSDISQEWANPNSDESGCGPTRDNCLPVSSEESNFRGKCDSPEIGSSKSNSDVYSGKSCVNGVDQNNNIKNNDDDNNNDSVDHLKLGQKSIKVEHAKPSDQITKDDSSSGSGSGSTVKCVSKSKSKRKIEVEQDNVSETRVHKFRRGNVSVIKKNNDNLDDDGGDVDDDDDKRKARLIRNRESAQLSRQRKKQYVEELEDKVRAMHSTITDLNTKISYFMTENASLRQQLSCAGGSGDGGGVAGHGMPVPGVYPVQPMVYPWMVYPPAYMVKHQGSNVPLVPIPRLKPQQVKKSCETKKEKEKEKGGGKTKKVASVSLLGLLFFMLLFGGIMPMVSVRYGGVKNGAVFIVDKKNVETKGFNPSNSSKGGNGSEPLVASLFVPRNDKLVKIDGNLIIHSVLASEKAMTSQSAKGPKSVEETGLAIHGSYPPYPTPRPGSNNWRRPHLDRNQNGRQRALGLSDDFTPIESDGKLQQWFREGLAGPMLSSGTCTEVFQFDISPTPGSIVPATSPANVTSEERVNTTRPNKPKNRKILQGHAIPFSDHSFNTTEEQNDGLESNKSRSSVVVSVLVDPREVGDGDGEGVIGSKTLPRIFVVVLIDSVKYVTYSCMLPFLGSSSHLVTA